MTRIKFCLTSRPFITAVILLSAFFVFNFVLAADNNVNDTLCSISEDDCDNYQANCQSHTFNWISGGYPSGAGNPQCCGDDSQENYVAIDARGYPVSFCCSDSSPFVKYSSCTTDSAVFNFSGLSVANNYYDSGTGHYIINWSWSGKTGTDGNAQYGFLLYDEDNNNITPCDGYNIFENTSWSQYADYVSCPDNWNGVNGSSGAYYFGPNENHCLKVVPVYQVSGVNYTGNSSTVCATTVNPTCGDNSIGTEGDTNQSVCEGVGVSGKWNLTQGDSSSMCWKDGRDNPNLCCGDDSSEYYTTCAVYNPGPVCAGSGACCDSGNLSGGRFDCVYNGTCYNIEGRIDTSDTGTDLEVCLLTNSSAASWVDSDQGFEDQGSGFNSCTGFGYSWLTNYCENGNSCDDYDANLSNGFCCGDDSSEFSITSYCPGYTGGAKCCNSSGDKIDASGACVSMCPDDTPPTISVIGAPLSWQYTDASANISCTDDGSGCYTNTYRLKEYTDTGGSCPTNYNDYDISYLPRNVTSHAWYCATGKDNADNAGFSTAPPGRIEFKVDKIAPKVDSLSPSSPAICSGSSVRISWESSDTGGAGVERVEAWQRPSGGSWSQIAGCANKAEDDYCDHSPTVTTEYGVHVIDRAGNCITETGAHCGGVSSDSLDTRTAYGPDTVTITSLPGTPGNPSYGSITRTSAIVSWTAGSGTTSYNLYRCTGASCTRPASATFTNVASPYTDDSLACSTTYRYWAEAINSCVSAGSGIFSSQGTNLTTTACDSAAPTISFNPTSRAWANTDVSVAATATDPNGVRYGRYCWTTNAPCDPLTTAANIAPFACTGASPCSANITQSSEGNWNLCVRARDNASPANWNAAPVCSGAYQIDKTGPIVNSFTEENVGLGGLATISVSGEKPTAKWNTSDTYSGVNHIEIWRTNYNSSNCNGATMTGCSWATMFSDNSAVNTTGRDDTTAVNGGDYWYGLHAIDNANNCSLENNAACGGNGNPIRVRITIAPSIPTNLHHTFNTVDSIDWQWDPSTGSPTSYLVYDEDGNYLDSTPITSFTWVNLTFPNKRYGIKVLAHSDAGDSGFTPVSQAYTSIERPGSVSCSAVTKTSLTANANGTISNPDPTNAYNSKIVFARNGSYGSWQTGLSADYSGLTCGTSYNFAAKTRNGDGEEETEVGANCSTLACVAGPDLIIDLIEMNDDLCQGAGTNVIATAKNIGDVNTGQSFKVKSYIDSTTGSGVQFMDGWVGPLAPGATGSLTDAVNTTGLSLGTHKIIAIADAPADSRINESNENNNTQEREFEVRNCEGGNNPPGPFNLISPENNSIGVTKTPILEWEVSVDPDGDTVNYLVYLCEGAGCMPEFVGSSSGTTYDLSALDGSMVYRWNVVAYDPENQTTNATNGPFSFTTMAEVAGGTPPAANFNWCKVSGMTLQFIDTSLPGDEPINSWSWNFDDGTPVSALQHPTHTFSASEPYSSPHFSWYSTMDSAAAIINPQVGPHGNVHNEGAISFVPGIDNNAMQLLPTAWGPYDYVSIPRDGVIDINSGAMVFWFKPFYAHTSNYVSTFLEADYGESEFEFIHSDHGDLYFKIEGPVYGNFFSVPPSNYSWEVNEWVKLEIRWKKNHYMAVYVNDAIVGCQTKDNPPPSGCTYYFGAINIGKDVEINPTLYVASSGRPRKLNGVMEDLMFFKTDKYALSGGFDTNFEVALTATDSGSDSNVSAKSVDLSSATPCSYNFTALASANCHTNELVWQSTPVGVYGYDIYRSDNSGSGPWDLVAAGALSNSYSDYDVNIYENSNYWYYITTTLGDYNNSTVSPACTGGVGGGSICPLTTLTPMCAMSGSQISAKHHCGEINLRWQKIENVKSYEIQKSFGSEGNYTTLLLIDQAEIPTYCPAGLNYCQYDDTEVVTVNNINPSNSQKYWYKIRAQGQDDTWSDWSTSINSFSYCYRSKAWQER